MDPKLYNALAKGDVAALLDQQFEPILHSQTTYQKYTSLHVAVQYEKEECVEAILNSCPSSLLLNVNTNGDTALHIAARQGHRRIIERIIDKAKSLGEEDIENGGKESIVRQLIKMANKNGDSALHEAVRNGRPKILVEKGRNGSTTVPSSPSVGTNDEMKYLLEAYPEFEYFENKAGATPLYLAALYKLDTCVSQILKVCQTSAHGGPDGTTAMHAAVMSKSYGIINRLHRVKPSISKEANKDGWTPLHYAAYKGDLECCESLMKTDSTVTYILDKEGMSPLHVAAAGRFNYEAIEVILKYCPDCWQVLDHKGRNYLHIAALRGCRYVLKCALGSDITTKESLNHPDIDGNTPLHLAAIYKAYDIVELLSKDDRVSTMDLNKENSTALGIIRNNLDPFEESDLYKKRMAAIGLLDKRAISPVYIIEWVDLGLPFKYKCEGKDQKDAQKVIKQVRNASNNHLVVAALIATVTFAAGFTMPGGFQSNGQPILLGKPMFKVFAISNTIAMVVSTLAVLIHFFMNMARDESTSFFVAWAFNCTFFAIMFMMLAFITGTYVVLSPSLGLAITTCVIGSSFYPLCYFPENLLRNSGMQHFSFMSISSFISSFIKLLQKLKMYE